MPTKLDPGSRKLKTYTYVLNSGSTPYQSSIYFDSGRNEIKYGDGGRLPNGHWPWKPCEHSQKNVFNGKFCIDAYCFCSNAQSRTKTFRTRSAYVEQPEALGKDPGWNPAVMRSIMDQLDLNKGESCLMYANVIQALPFLGAATKLTSILNNAARQFGKDLRKKPFTTAVKTLISADFVDRFVISPTIDDARKFATATNYVANKLATVEERNSHRFALDAELETVYKDREYGPYSSSSFSNDIGWRYKYRQRFRTRAVDKAYALLEATYSTDALTPFRLWANRTGFSKPLDSAWDLVPFSFVLDYFFRAGDFIAGLSEDMSRDEGLSGTITKIHGLWGSHLYESTCEVQASDISFENRGRYYPITNRQYCYTDFPVVRSCVYKRFPVADPWLYLLPFEEKLSDYLTVNLSLSSTRKRTLAELVIQAKL